MQAFFEKGMITHPNEIDENDDYYSDNEEEPNNDPENDEEADDENEAKFDFQEEAADPVNEMLQKKQVCMGSHFISNFKKRNTFSSRRSRFSRLPVTNRDQIDLWDYNILVHLLRIEIDHMNSISHHSSKFHNALDFEAVLNQVDCEYITYGPEHVLF